eukprot:scpid41381/ scgid19317/ 
MAFTKSFYHFMSSFADPCMQPFFRVHTCLFFAQRTPAVKVFLVRKPKQFHSTSLDLVCSCSEGCLREQEGFQQRVKTGADADYHACFAICNSIVCIPVVIGSACSWNVCASQCRQQYNHPSCV